MELFWTCFFFLVGLLLIVKGGDIFVDAATWMAEASGIPKFIIGATIVSVATTLPEIIVSCFAAAKGSADMAIGNAIGSVSANTGLIMGLSVIFAPIAVKRSQISVKGALMILSVGVLTLLCLNGALTIWEALIVLLLFVAFIAENLYSASKDKQVEQRPQVTRPDLIRNLVAFVLGAAALAIGSRLLVNNGTTLATLLGIPERVIAITLVAIGTSLPELVTAITALVKKQGAMSVGNIIGANIIDITVILPVCAIISGGTLGVSANCVRLDMPLCLAESVLAVVPTVIFKKFSRIQGVLMVALYLAYLVFSIMA